MVAMKRVLRQIFTVLRRNWAVGVAVMVLAASAGAFVLGQRHGEVHEGGLLQAQRTPKPVAKLPDTTAKTIDQPQSVAATNCSNNASGKLLLVSISQQHVWACDGTSLASQSAVTTGASGLTNVDDATPTGTWHIYSKQTNRHLTGCDVNGCWNDPVAYWMPFDDQVGFHDASWQTFPFGSNLYTTQGSHGCVHLPLDFITWVYGWAPVGTTVTVKA